MPTRWYIKIRNFFIRDPHGLADRRVPGEPKPTAEDGTL
jgi:hypothetical protein